MLDVTSVKGARFLALFYLKEEIFQAPTLEKHTLLERSWIATVTMLFIWSHVLNVLVSMWGNQPPLLN